MSHAPFYVLGISVIILGLGGLVNVARFGRLERRVAALEAKIRKMQRDS